MNRPYKRILIFCEGLTEYYYAKSLQENLPRERRRILSVEYNHDSDNNPGTMLKKALLMMRQAKLDKVAFDQVWMIFDNDNRSGLAEVFQDMSKNKIGFIFNSISIEHWFLLHFDNCGRAFSTAEEVINSLKRFLPGYHKTKMNHYHVLSQNLETAKQRARILRNNCDGSVPVFKQNPWMNMDELIDFFDKLQN